MMGEEVRHVFQGVSDLRREYWIVCDLQEDVSCVQRKKERKLCAPSLLSWHQKTLSIAEGRWQRRTGGRGRHTTQSPER